MRPVARPVESQLLTGERDEDVGTLSLAMVACQRRRELDQTRRTAGIVVRSVVDLADELGQKGALAAAPEVVIMRSEDHSLLAQLLVQAG